MENKQRAIKVLDAEASQALSVAAEYVMQVDSGSKEKTQEYYIQKAYAANTYRSYRADYKDFVVWAGIERPVPVSATVIAQYLTDRAQMLAPTTLTHRVAALSFIHRLMGYEDPTNSPLVTALLRGIRKDRTDDGWSSEQAPAFNLEQLQAMLAEMGDSIHDRRDRCFMLVGLFGAFRQSELTGLRIEQLQFSKQGVSVAMGVVKQDQTGSQKRYKALPRILASPACPVKALELYLAVAGIEAGPVFRGVDRYGNVGTAAMSKNTANRIIQKWAARALLPNAQEYSVHSFRASFVTVLRGLGVSDALIARQTDHRNLATMQVYDRPESAYDNNPALVLAGALSEYQY
jgi:integrase